MKRRRAPDGVAHADEQCAEAISATSPRCASAAPKRRRPTAVGASHHEAANAERMRPSSRLTMCSTMSQTTAAASATAPVTPSGSANAGRMRVRALTFGRSQNFACAVGQYASGSSFGSLAQVRRGRRTMAYREGGSTNCEGGSVSRESECLLESDLDVVRHDAEDERRAATVQEIACGRTERETANHVRLPVTPGFHARNAVVDRKRFERDHLRMIPPVLEHEGRH